MKLYTLIALVLPLLLGAAECEKFEAEFADLDKEYRMAKTVQSPTARYDYYYRYIVKGAELMAWCRNDQRNYKYAEIVRKLRDAERERAGLRQRVIEEQWKVNNVKPIIKYVYQNCTISN